ncbi:MAG: glycosyltransferase family 39 protein [Patescibacteria group bacterium]|nr:glycosyltransferase family 39 protein [Patescibacteria group bacterium]
MHSVLAFLRRNPGKSLLLAIFFLFCIAYLAAAGNGFGYYRHLAAALLSGRLDVDSGFIDPLHLRDFSFFNGRYFYPMGILPALVLLPMVLVFGINFPQTALVLVLTAAITWLLYRIARRFQFSESDALWIALGVLVGSPLAFLVLRGTVFDTYLTHLLSFACLLGALAEYQGRRRWFAMGALVGLSALARPLTIFAALFFFAAAWTDPHAANARWKKIYIFFLPLAGAVIVIAAYNYLRFGNLFEVGYAFQLMPPEVIAARQTGLFSVRHFLDNFYRAFLALPVPVLAPDSQKSIIFPYLTFSGKGTSLLLTFPLLFLLLWVRKFPRENIFAFLTAAAIALPNLAAFANGEYQFGYRYGFDFFPFLLFALLAGLPAARLKRAGKILIITGALLNAGLTLPVLFGLA